LHTGPCHAGLSDGRHFPPLALIDNSEIDSALDRPDAVYLFFSNRTPWSGALAVGGLPGT